MDEIENATEVPEVEQQTENQPVAEPDNQDNTPEQKEEPQETEAERAAKRARNRALREKKWAEDDLRREREENARLRREFEQRRTEQPADLRPESFGTQAEYEQAINDPRLKAAFEHWRNQERQQARQQAEQTEMQKALEVFAQKQEEAREVYPDFDEVIESAASTPVNPHVQRALVEADNSADLLFFFAKNPAELEKLNRLNPYVAALKIGKMDAKFQRPTTKASAAPKPIKPVTTAQSAPSGEPDPSDEKAWLAWRTKQVQKQHSR